MATMVAALVMAASTVTPPGVAALASPTPPSAPSPAIRSNVRSALAAVRRAWAASGGRYDAMVDVQEWRGAAYVWAELRLTRESSGELRIDGLRGRGAGGTIRLVPDPRTGGDAATVSASALPFVRFGVAAAALRSLRDESARALDPGAVLRCLGEHADAVSTGPGPTIDGHATTRLAWARSGARCAGEPATDAAITRDEIDADADTGSMLERRELEGDAIVARVRYRARTTSGAEQRARSLDGARAETSPNPAVMGP